MLDKNTAKKHNRTVSLLNLGYILTIRRIYSNWLLELVLFLGILLGVTLLSSGVIFSNVLAEAALRTTLTAATKEQANILVRVFNDLDEPNLTGRTPRYENSVALVDQHVSSKLLPYISRMGRHLQTSTFFFAGHPHLELENDLRPRGQIQHMTDLKEPELTELISGRWPETLSSLSQTNVQDPLEVVIDQSGSHLLDLGIGDSMEIFPASGLDNPVRMNIKIVGMFRRINTEDDIWYGREKDFSYKDKRWTFIPLFTTELGITDQIASSYPGLYSNVTWVYQLDRQNINANQVPMIQSVIHDIKFHLSSRLENSSNTVKLNRVLDTYSEQLLLARIPILLMIFLVCGILVYYLALAANLIVRTRSSEIAVIKSRGATTTQIGILAMIEGFLLAIPALIIGIFVAPVIGRSLGSLLFNFEADSIPIMVTPEAVIIGTAGALLSVLVLTGSTIIGARHGIIEFRQAGARPPHAPLIHRYYIDFLLLGILLLIWLQIETGGDFITTNITTGEPRLDYTLLLGPVIGLLAFGLIILRIFPIAARLVSGALERLGPAWLVQGLRRISRDPILPGTLVVLLTLATALGIIGSALSSTLGQNQLDRSMYEVGADLRIEHNGDRFPTRTFGLSDLSTQLPNTAGSAEALRVTGHLLTRGFNTGRISVLAVDTDSFSQAAWYRPDFVDGMHLEELMSNINPVKLNTSPLLDPNHGLKLPEDATTLGAWVQPGMSDPRLGLSARVIDSNGTYLDISFGTLENPGWQLLQAPLYPDNRNDIRGSTSSKNEFPAHFGKSDQSDIRPPLTLLSLQITSLSGVEDPGIIFFDQLTTVGPFGDQTIANTQDLSNWQVIEDFSAPGLNALENNLTVTRQGSSNSVAFSWSASGIGTKGIRPGPAEEAIPVIISPSLSKDAAIGIGDHLSLGLSSYSIPIEVSQIADYFPTLDPRYQPFMVLDQSAYIHYSNLHSSRIIGGPNELWVRLDHLESPHPDFKPAFDSKDLRIKKMYSGEQVIKNRTEQPLNSAGWGGLLIIMFLALLLASCTGMILFAYVDTRERLTEYALLRTLGSSHSQVNAIVWFNLLLVIGIGALVGTLVGQQIGILLLPILEISENGLRVTPPMIFQINWIILLLAYLLMGIVFICSGLWLSWFTKKLEIQRVLRAGESG